MKKTLSLLTAILFIFLTISASAFSVTAKDAPTDNFPVPQIRITTEDGNGTALQKTDGYVGATITITDTVGSVLSDAVQFKVRGNSTALPSITKKAFTFKFDKKKDVLGMGKGKKWALIANAFDPTLMRNYIAFDFAREMGLDYTSQQRYVELWVDDSYRGCYTLMEPVQAGTDRVDIDIESNNGKKDFMIEREASRVESDVTYFKTDGIRFAVSEPEEPNAEQLAYIQSTMDEIMTVIKSGDKDTISEKIDIPSFVRFYLLNELYKTVDFDFSSVFFYYKNGVLYAGPAWDYDLAAGNGSAEYSAQMKSSTETEDLYAANYHLYQYLCSYDWFNDKIYETYCAYSGYIGKIYAKGGLMDELLSHYGWLFSRNFSDAGWSPATRWVNVQRSPDKTFDANVDYLRNWLRDRNKWLCDYYKIPIENDTPDDDEEATISVTGIKLDKTSASLISGKTVTLKATVSPSNATDKSVTWSTSNKSIATVTAKGVVKGVKAGTATITAKSSNGKKATCKITVSYATPKITKFENTVKGTKITWSKSNGAEKYRVFWKVSGKWKKLADTTATSYVNTKVKSGAKYTYTVRCISKDGKTNTSAYDTKGKTYRFIATPAVPTLKNTKKGISVSWKKPAGAVKYRIFRRIGNGKWKKLADTTKTSYVDKTAKNGKTYSYTIRCISKDGKSFTSGYNAKGKSIKCKR